MIEKSFRLSNAFRHTFLPNSSRLFSPQNIQIEIWDINKRAKESKFHPGIFCMRNIEISNQGNIFVIRGGCNNGQSEFRIYETDTLNCIDEFSLMEECSNAKFTNDDKCLVFGTWSGNIYSYNIEEKKLAKQFSLENHSFNLIHNGKHNNNLYIAAVIKASEHNNYANHYILDYDIAKKTGSQICFADKINIRRSEDGKVIQVSGLALHNKKLAILISSYGGKENEKVVSTAKTYIYDTETKEITLIKENFKMRDVFDRHSCIAWSNSGNKLAFIGLNEVYITDTESNDEKAVPFERASSVAFSNCDMGIAVGGDKAKLFKI